MKNPVLTGLKRRGLLSGGSLLDPWSLQCQPSSLVTQTASPCWEESIPGLNKLLAAARYTDMCLYDYICSNIIKM